MALLSPSMYFRPRIFQNQRRLLGPLCAEAPQESCMSFRSRPSQSLGVAPPWECSLCILRQDMRVQQTAIRGRRLWAATGPLRVSHRGPITLPPMTRLGLCQTLPPGTPSHSRIGRYCPRTGAIHELLLGRCRLLLSTGLCTGLFKLFLQLSLIDSATYISVI